MSKSPSRVENLAHKFFFFRNFFIEKDANISVNKNSGIETFAWMKKSKVIKKKTRTRAVFLPQQLF